MNETESFFFYNDNHDNQSCQVDGQDTIWHTCSYDESNGAQNIMDYEGYFLPSPSLPPQAGGVIYSSPGNSTYLPDLGDWTMITQRFAMSPSYHIFSCNSKWIKV